MGTRDNDGSVSSMQTDPVEVRLMTDKYFEEQASLGNSVLEQDQFRCPVYKVTISRMVVAVPLATVVY